METALMGNSEFDDVAAHLLEPEESLDSEETGIDLDEGYSPPESPRELGAWGLTASEARTHESLARRLAREVPDVTVGGMVTGSVTAPTAMASPLTIRSASRAGRLVAFGVDPTDPTTDYRAHDVGIDGGAASAEEAAMHISPKTTPSPANDGDFYDLVIWPRPWCHPQASDGSSRCRSVWLHSAPWRWLVQACGGEGGPIRSAPMPVASRVRAVGARRHECRR
jgi:hypothetical protein